MALVIGVEPIRGEFLPGLISRASAANYLPSTRLAFRAGNFGAVTSGQLAFKTDIDSSALALQLNTKNVDLIEMMLHRRAEGGRVRFFGTTIPSDFVERQVRRVAPSQLKASAHVRAIWQVRPLSFDPQTREMLLDACPACDAKLGFLRTWGVQVCDQCSRIGRNGFDEPRVDLRDFPQRIVEVEDEEALEFVVGLIDPRRTSSRTSDTNMHEELADQSRGELFSFAVAIAATLAHPIDGSPDLVGRPKKSDFAATISPDGLATAGRVLLDWPRTFVSICEQARDHAPFRKGTFGKRKSLGPLAVLQRNSLLTARQKVIVEEALGTMGWKRSPSTSVAIELDLNPSEVIPLNTAFKELHVGKAVLARLAKTGKVSSWRLESEWSPTLFSRGELTRVVRSFQDEELSVHAAARLGLPIEALAELRATGMLHWMQGALRYSASKAAFYSSSINSLLRKIEVAIAADKVRTQEASVADEREFVLLSQLMLRHRPGRRPWATALRDVVEGNLEARLPLATERPQKMLNELRVPATYRPKPTDNPSSYLPLETPFSVRSVSLSLGIGLTSSAPYIDAGLFSDAGSERTAVTFGDVLRFGDTFILGNELAARTGIPVRSLRKLLEQKSVFVRPAAGSVKGLVVRREDIEPLLSANAFTIVETVPADRPPGLASK